MNITNTISATIDLLSRRITKILRNGSSEVLTGFETGPAGTDSCPTPNMRAIYSETGIKGKGVIVGYINEHQLAAMGEHRIYATDPTGQTIMAYIWMKSDGSYHFGGDVNHLVQFEALQSGFNQLKNDYNKLVDAFNAHVHLAAGSPTAIPTPGTGIPAIHSVASVDNAEILNMTTA